MIDNKLALHQFGPSADQRLAAVHSFRAAESVKQPPHSEPLAAAATLTGRRRKLSTTIRLDSDVLSWLREPGPGYQSRINAILRREMIRARKG